MSWKKNVHTHMPLCWHDRPADSPDTQKMIWCFGMLSVIPSRNFSEETKAQELLGFLSRKVSRFPIDFSKKWPFQDIWICALAKRIESFKLQYLKSKALGLKRHLTVFTSLLQCHETAYLAAIVLMKEFLAWPITLWHVYGLHNQLLVSKYNPSFTSEN